MHLENHASFNAGKGAAFTKAGTHELEAAIMDGKNGGYGAVACITKTKNPVIVAKKIMDTCRHSLLVGPAADRFAMASGLEQVSNDYFTTAEKKKSTRRNLHLRLLSLISTEIRQLRGLLEVLTENCKAGLAIRLSLEQAYMLIERMQ